MGAWGGLGGGKGVGVGWGGGWGIWEISWIILDFPGIFRLVPRTKIDILNRQIKIFTVGLKENNSEIMLNPPAQYLRKFNFHAFAQVLPNTFK